MQPRKRSMKNLRKNGIINIKKGYSTEYPFYLSSTEPNLVLSRFNE